MGVVTGGRRSRSPINSRTRRAKRQTILDRDGATCWICRLPLVDDAGPDDLLRTTMDHVVPVVDGGGNSNANLRLAHRICNETRGRVHYALSRDMPLPASRDAWSTAIVEKYGEWAAQFDDDQEESAA